MKVSAAPSPGFCFRQWGSNLGFSLLVVFSLLSSTRADSLTAYFTWNIQGEIVSPDHEDSAGLERWAALSTLSRDSLSVIIDMGNTLFPGFLSRYSFGSLTNEVMSQIGYAAKAVTLKDFLKGREQLTKLSNQARFHYISANIIDKTTRETLFPPSLVRHYDSLRVKVYSVAAPGDQWEVSNWDYEKLEVLDPAQALRAVVNAGRAAGRSFSICVCERRVVEQFPAILSVKGIDLFVIGVPAFSRGPQRLEERFTNGTRVLYVPEVKTGVGKITIPLTGSGPVSFGVVEWDSLPSDSVAKARVARLVNKWYSLYQRENASDIVTMDSALTRNHLEVVGNLLREWGQVEFACIEQSLITGYNLPAKVRTLDLDRLLASAPDLLRTRLTGDEIQRFQRSRGLVWVGFDKGKIAGRALRRQETYTVLLTENAYRLLRMEHGKNGAFPSVTPLRTSVFDAIAQQLARRRRRDYDFGHLDRRWRFLAESATEVSFRKVDVGNADSVNSLSGVTYKPFSAWNLNARVPLSLYNGFHRVDLQPRLEYAATNGVTGRNVLDLRLQYVVGTSPAASPYASANYQSYLKLEPGEKKPVRFRVSLGAETSPGDWKFKAGFGAEKSRISTETNPFMPLREMLLDTGTWGPGLEISAAGSYSIDALLRKWKVNLAPYQELKLDIQADNYLVERNKEIRSENKVSIDLTASPTARIRLKTGYRIYYAYLFTGKRQFYNLEPSLSILGTYLLKW